MEFHGSHIRVYEFFPVLDEQVVVAQYISISVLQ